MKLYFKSTESPGGPEGADNMSVRRAIESDFVSIHSLLEQLMPGEADHRQAIWRDALRDEGYYAWVAEVDRKPVGFVDLFVIPDVAHGRNIGLINNLVIDDRFRGRGLGESLLREAIEHCRRRDAVEVHVWTEFDNARAIGLYKKLGFADRALLLELELTGRPPS